MMTGYFLFGSKLAGLIIQPFNSTPSLVLKEKNSLLGKVMEATLSFKRWLSTNVISSLPVLSLMVMSGGVLMFENVLMKYFMLLLKIALFVPSREESLVLRPFASIL